MLAGPAITANSKAGGAASKGGAVVPPPPKPKSSSSTTSKHAPSSKTHEAAKKPEAKQADGAPKPASLSPKPVTPAANDSPAAAKREPAKEPSGTMLYEAVRKLRDHWAGEVWEGQRFSDGAKAVLTVIPRKSIGDERAKRTAMAMARVAAGLGQSAIARSRSLIELDEHRMAIVSDWYEGRSLRELERDGMSRALVLDMLAQVSAALDKTHAIGCLHGSLSIDSVILEERAGRPDRVLLTDFGLSEIFGEAGPSKTKFASDIPAAPERSLGSDRSPLVDVYQVGALGYRMLAGRPVFEGKSVEAVRRSHAIEDPVPVATRVGQGVLHPTTAYAIDRCLAKVPEDRFSDMESVHEALVEALEATGHNPSMDTLTMQLSEVSGTAEPGETESTEHLRPDVDAPKSDGEGSRGEAQPDADDSKLLRSSGDMPQADVAVATAAETVEPEAGGKNRVIYAAVAGVVVLAGIIGVWAMGGDDEPEAAPTIAAAPDDGSAVAPEAAPDSEPAPEAVPSEPEAVPAEIEPAEGDGVPGDPEIGAGTDEAPTPTDPEIVAADESAVAADPVMRGGGGDPAPRETQSAAQLVERAGRANRAGQMGQARKLYENALAQEPRNVKALVGLGDIHFNKSDYGRAAKYFKKAKSASPRNGKIRLSLGDAYFKQGKNDLARAQYEKAQELGVAAAARRLKKL